jgi:thiamine kinase-like enzyme
MKNQLGVGDVKVPELPAQLHSRSFVRGSLRKNLISFADPQHWRLKLEEIARESIDFLSFRPPVYDVMFQVITRKKETLFFYESVLLRKKAGHGERVYCCIEADGEEFCLVDSFSSSEFVGELLEGFCAGEKWGSLGFIGNFLGISGKAKVRVKSLKSLFKPKDEPTANYIYRCRGEVVHEGIRKKFDIVIKKFLPRSPPDRGNREYRLAGVLPQAIVPKVHGVMVNYSHQVPDGYQVLLLFSDFVEGNNVGMELWDLMLTIDKKRRLKKNYDTQLRKLLQIMKEVSEEVVFPFHSSLYDTWRGFAPSMRVPMRGTMKYFEEFEKGIEALSRLGLLDKKDAVRYRVLFDKAWKEIVSDLEAIEIHADLMWGQIIRAKNGKLIVLDFDEHMLAPPAKDLADLCAASRFLVESLPCKDKEFFRMLAEQMNGLLVDAYKKKAKRWGKQVERSLSVYMALRHLHDAAYHLPIWMEAVDPKVRQRHEKYVNLSMRWLRQSMEQLGRLLKA